MLLSDQNSLQFAPPTSTGLSKDGLCAFAAPGKLYGTRERVRLCRLVHHVKSQQHLKTRRRRVQHMLHWGPSAPGSLVARLPSCACASQEHTRVPCLLPY